MPQSLPISMRLLREFNEAMHAQCLEQYLAPTKLLLSLWQ